MPNSFMSRSVKNLKNDFSKLLNLNELLRDTLIEYNNNSMPEEPVMPIMAAFGVFYLMCWISFMIGHIIPGKIIMDKARLGINYHYQAVEYFPLIISLGLILSFICSIFELKFNDELSILFSLLSIFSDHFLLDLFCRIKSITESINNDFKEMTECINKTLNIDSDKNTSDDDSGIVITVIEQ